MKIAFLVFFLIFSFELKAQISNPDSLFIVAKNFAYSKQYDVSDSICIAILKQYPDYLDAHLLRGLIFSWTKQYQLARNEFSHVLSLKADYLDAILASINNEFWSNNYITCIEEIEKALVFYPNNEQLLLKQAEAYFLLEDYDPALQLIEYLLLQKPSETSYQYLKDKIINKKNKQLILVEYRLDVFDQVFNPWHTATFGFKRKTKKVDVQLNFNYVSRFQSNDYQFELDLYPKINSKTYFNLNAAYSPSNSLFPVYRLYADIYRGFEIKSEFSAGILFMKFKPLNLLNIRASYNQYIGSYWFDVRVFYTTLGTNQQLALQLKLRKYLNRFGEYVAVFGGSGAYAQIVNNTDSVPLNFNLKNSFGFGLEYRKKITSTQFIRFSSGYNTEKRVNYDLHYLFAGINYNLSF